MKKKTSHFWVIHGLSVLLAVSLYILLAPNFVATCKCAPATVEPTLLSIVTAEEEFYTNNNSYFSADSTSLVDSFKISLAGTNRFSYHVQSDVPDSFIVFATLKNKMGLAKPGDNIWINSDNTRGASTDTIGSMFKRFIADDWTPRKKQISPTLYLISFLIVLIPILLHIFIIIRNRKLEKTVNDEEV